MQLSGKHETFSEISAAFLKSSLNFAHFQKNMSLIAEVFPKLRTRKNLVRSMTKKSSLEGSFAKQPGQSAKLLLKFAWQQLEQIY